VAELRRDREWRQGIGPRLAYSSDGSAWAAGTPRGITIFEGDEPAVAAPYTDGLLRAIPVPDPNAETGEKDEMPGELPSPINPPSGCRFRTRCPRAQERCATEEPVMREMAPGHHVACHFPLDATT